MNDGDTKRDVKASAKARSPEALRVEMEALVLEKEHLDEAIEALEQKGINDPLIIRKLKKQKLNVLDHIARLEDSLGVKLFARSEENRGSDFATDRKFGYDTDNKNKKRIFRGSLEGSEGPLVQRSLRLSEELSHAVEAAARASGLSQQEWMRRQFRVALSDFQPNEPSGTSEGHYVPHEGLSTTAKVPKKQINLRLEEPLFAAVMRAVEEADVPRNDWLRAAVVRARVEGLDVHETLEPGRQSEQDIEP
mgnify:CR=1 FL=1